METEPDKIVELPELPSKKVVVTIMPNDYFYGFIYGYTAQQMRDYAGLAVKNALSR